MPPDVNAARLHRFVRGRSSAVVAPLDDRRPVGGGSSYRAGGKHFLRVPRPAAGSGAAIAATTWLRARSRTVLFRDSRDAIPEDPIAAVRWPDRPIFPREFFIRSGKRPPTASGVDTGRARRPRIRCRTDSIEASDVRAGKTRQRSFKRYPGLPMKR
jgi:hypothetical protein